MACKVPQTWSLTNDTARLINFGIDSASIAVATAILSALKKIPVNQNTAMTGSLSVRGDVLPIGGLKEKLIAAHKAGMLKVLIPTKNYERDLEDIPKEVKDAMEIVGVTRVEEVLKQVLV